MSQSVINLADLQLRSQRHGERFEALVARIGPLIGARKLGIRLVEVPAGKSAWPFHSHHVNEEMFVILEGTGELRLGDAMQLIRAGDVIACPPGAAAAAHQIRASDDGTIRYLAISTMHDTDVMEYPDSGKIGVFSGAAPGGDERARQVALFVPSDAGVDYWQGEDGAD
jgi:uncharacterized cupin superfamily protein